MIIRDETPVKIIRESVKLIISLPLEILPIVREILILQRGI